MDKIKVFIGLVIIVASFIYILRNKGSMLDNLLAKSKKEYEQRQAIKEKAMKAVGGETREEIEADVNARVTKMSKEASEEEASEETASDKG